MTRLPWTPDFYHYSDSPAILKAQAKGTHVNIVWEDGCESQYDVFSVA